MSEIERLSQSLRYVDVRLEATGEYVQFGEGADLTPLVRAILQAMREPSEKEVIVSGALSSKDVEVDYDDALRVWQAMIDHILAERESLGHHGVKARDRAWQPAACDNDE